VLNDTKNVCGADHLMRGALCDGDPWRRCGNAMRLGRLQSTTTVQDWTSATNLGKTPHRTTARTEIESSIRLRLNDEGGP
jgi:hypothetical protein